MGFREELRLLKKTALFWVGFLVLATTFFFLFGVGTVSIGGESIRAPLPQKDSFAVAIFRDIETRLVPAGVELIVTNPFTAFLTQIKIALLSALMLSLPFLLYGFARYLSPALYAREKHILSKVVAPSFILFISGALFAYLIVIPPTFSILYSYASNFAVVPFFSVQEFIPVVFGLSIMTGILFLLPVFMYLLSRLGIVDGVFWRSNWRYALVTFLIFSAIITPDGSGISMMLLVAPMAGLYALGIGVSGGYTHSANTQQQTQHESEDIHIP